jgi:hypothetical protein
MKSMLPRAFLGLACTLFASLPAFASIDLSIGSANLSPAGSTTVGLDISGLGNGTALGAFDVSVAFNPNVVSLSTASYGDSALGDQLNLEGLGTFTSTTQGTGTVELAELSFDTASALTSAQALNFTLASLTFNAVGSGTSALDVSVNALGDQLGNSISPTIEDGTITVGSGTLQAPELDPNSSLGAVMLLCGTLLVLRGRKRL